MQTALFATPLILCIAVLLDRWLGEPRRLHPLVGFGWLARRVDEVQWARLTAALSKLRR